MPGPVLSPWRRLGSDRVEGHSADTEAGETDRYREAGKPMLEVQQPSLLEASGVMERGGNILEDGQTTSVMSRYRQGLGGSGWLKGPVAGGIEKS